MRYKRVKSQSSRYAGATLYTKYPAGEASPLVNYLIILPTVHLTALRDAPPETAGVDVDW